MAWQTIILINIYIHSLAVDNYSDSQERTNNLTITNKRRAWLLDDWCPSRRPSPFKGKPRLHHTTVSSKSSVHAQDLHSWGGDQLNWDFPLPTFPGQPNPDRSHLHTVLEPASHFSLTFNSRWPLAWGYHSSLPRFVTTITLRAAFLFIPLDMLSLL